MEIDETRERLEATEEVCEFCDAGLFNHDAPELFDRWWVCGICWNDRVGALRERTSRLEEALRQFGQHPGVGHDAEGLIFDAGCPVCAALESESRV